MPRAVSHHTSPFSYTHTNTHTLILEVDTSLRVGQQPRLSTLGQSGCFDPWPSSRLSQFNLGFVLEQYFCLHLSPIYILIFLYYIQYIRNQADPGDMFQHGWLISHHITANYWLSQGAQKGVSTN